MRETDLIDLSVGDDGDIQIVDGDLVFTFGADAVLQLCQEGLETLRGEVFVDEDEGMPWVESSSVTADQAILGSRYDEQRIRDEVSRLLSSRPEVDRIEKIAISHDPITREVSVDFTVHTTFGPVSGSAVI